MRKSSLVILVLMLVAFGGILLAADVMVLRPAKRNLAIAEELEGLLGPHGRDWIVPGSRVKLALEQGTRPGRLAGDKSWGIAVQVEPKRETLLAKGRALYMAGLIADLARDKGQGEREIAWVEIIYRLGEVDPVHTLIRFDAEADGWAAPDPPIPSRFRETDLPPKPAIPLPGASGAGSGD